MDVIEILESREKSIQIDAFVQQTKQVFNHYQALKSKIAMEYIAINLSAVKTLKKSHIKGNLEDVSVLAEMRNQAENLLKSRMGKQAGLQIAFSLVVSFLWYVFFIEVIKAQLIVAGISSVAAFFIIIYFLMKTTSKRLIATSQKIYAQQVDPRVLSYFEHYYS